jgi:hypothetical protein
MMKYWIESQQMTDGEMIGPDGLHMTDKSYRCLGLAAARVVSSGINRSLAAGTVVAIQK